MMMKLNCKFNAVDVYKTYYGKKVVTFGIEETVLTHKADHGTEQCLDYVFEIDDDQKVVYSNFSLNLKLTLKA